MPMNTFKKSKNKKIELRKNVKKSTADYIQRQVFNQNNDDKQRWESLRKKYEYKGDNND